MSPQPAEIVGRETELERIEAVLAVSQPLPAIVVIAGEPGIGKTTLWRAAVDDAGARGYRVLACAADGAESQLSFTVLRDLLADVFDEVGDELPGPQRRALSVTLLREDPDRQPPDPGSIAVALQSAVRTLASHRPTIVAIDDTQWVDAGSAAPLRYALRRLRGEQVVFLLGQRTGAGDPLQLEQAMAVQPEVIELGPLPLGALARILQRRLGTAYPRPTLHRLHTASAGNPFHALELARALDRAEEPLRPGAPLLVHGSLPELVRRRLAEVPDATAHALAVVAALSRPALRMVAGALDEDPARLLEPALDARLIEIHGAEIRFTHPLYAAAAYETVSAGQRQQIHRKLAEISPDAEERARHLSLATTEPAEEVAAALEGAALEASGRGATAAAADLAEAAFRLTPEAAVGSRSARALDAGWLEFIAGDSARARVLLTEAERTAPPGLLRARARTRLAWLDHHAGDRRAAFERLTAALADTDDPGQRAEIYSLLAWAHSITREDVAKAAGYARRAVALCDGPVDNPVLLADSLSVLAQCEFFLGHGLPSAAMDRALALRPSESELRVLRRPTNHWALMLLCADRFDEARPLFQEVQSLAVAHGDESALPWPLMRLSHLELAAGDWQAAHRYAEQGLEMAMQTGQAPGRAYLTSTLALVLAHFGREVEAREVGSEGLELSRACGAGIGERIAGWALGALDVAQGNAADAVERLGALWRRSTEAGVIDPGENRYLADLGEALVHVGDLEGADRLANELEALGKRLERPSAVGAALRIRGLAAAADHDPERALSVLADATVEHTEAGLPFELGRTLLALGSTQRRVRHRRKARDTLQRAAAIFEELGSGLWGERARVELTRIGGRAPSPEGLTPTERRVAELVVAGRTNREVAAELVVSVHTVEGALTSVYRKLGVRSRTEMARRLAAPD